MVLVVFCCVYVLCVSVCALLFLFVCVVLLCVIVVVLVLFVFAALCYRKACAVVVIGLLTRTVEFACCCWYMCMSVTLCAYMFSCV